MPTRWAHLGLGACIAATVAFADRAQGAYEVTAWGPLGLALVCAAGIALASGRRPVRYAAASAGALVALGAWSVISTSWGGLPAPAWTTFNKSMLAASALLLGASLGESTVRGTLVLVAVLAGVTAQAVEVLARVAAASSPSGWFDGRVLDGPVGYHNAQGAVFALGIPLAFWMAASRQRIMRVAGGGSVGILAGALLLTQSRGSLIAVGLALAIQVAYVRDLRLSAFAALAVIGTAALAIALRSVDAALLEGTEADRVVALREYVLWTGLAALALGVLAAPSLRPLRVKRSLLAGLAAAVLVAAGGAAFSERQALVHAASAISELRSDAPPDAPPGSTRFERLSLNGRRDAWRVARGMAASAPVIGEGQGQFARQWTMERRLRDLYLLQPHSLELELLGELGVVGLAVFAAFGVLAVSGVVRGRSRASAAAALGALTALVAQASIDWIWSFPAVVAPTLLVVGAAAGARPRRRLPLAAKALLVVMTVAAAVSLAGPYLAARQLARATALQTSDVTHAWSHSQAARKVNPWDPSIASLQGRLAEATGAFRLAAERYRAAADLSQRPWLEHFAEARALRKAGALKASRAACRRAFAENPAEKLLRTGPCSATALVAAAPRGVPPGFDSVVTDAGCSVTTTASGELQATIQGGADNLDTAYALKDFGGPSGLAGRVYARDVIRLAQNQTLAANLAVFQVRDANNALVYELYIGPDRILRLWSPSGGLRSTSLNSSTGVLVPNDGSSTIRVEVSALANSSVTVRVNDLDKIVLTGLSGATSGNQRYLRAGIEHYDTTTTAERVAVDHSAVAVSQSGWLGP